MGRLIFATSSLRHARKRDANGLQIAGAALCGARTSRTGDDGEATCGNCKRKLAIAAVREGRGKERS